MAGQRVSIVRCCASVTKEGGWGWLRALFGPQAEREGGEGRQRIWGVELRPCSQRLRAGRARWDLQPPGPIQTCLRPSFLLALGHASQVEPAGGRGPQHRRRWHVLMPRTDSVPSSTRASPGRGSQDSGSSHHLSWTSVSSPVRNWPRWSLRRLPRSVCPPGAEPA